MASKVQNPNDWQARFETVKNSFSSRIGRLCNTALDWSVLAYDEERREWYEEIHRQKITRFFKDTDWEKADSPAERLPYLGHQLKKKTKKLKPKPAPDELLFTFAVEGWKEPLK